MVQIGAHSKRPGQDGQPVEDTGGSADPAGDAGFSSYGYGGRGGQDDSQITPMTGPQSAGGSAWSGAAATDVWSKPRQPATSAPADVMQPADVTQPADLVQPAAMAQPPVTDMPAAAAESAGTATAAWPASPPGAERQRGVMSPSGSVWPEDLAAPSGSARPVGPAEAGTTVIAKSPSGSGLPAGPAGTGAAGPAWAEHTRPADVTPSVFAAKAESGATETNGGTSPAGPPAASGPDFAKRRVKPSTTDPVSSSTVIRRYDPLTGPRPSFTKRADLPGGATESPWRDDPLGGSAAAAKADPGPAGPASPEPASPAESQSSVSPAWPAESQSSVLPAGPARSIESQPSVSPAGPARSIESQPSVSPAGPARPIESQPSVSPPESASSAESASSVWPAEPTTSVWPAESAWSSEPAGPLGATEPTWSADPAGLLGAAAATRPAGSLDATGEDQDPAAAANPPAPAAPAGPSWSLASLGLVAAAAGETAEGEPARAGGSGFGGSRDWSGGQGGSGGPGDSGAGGTSDWSGSGGQGGAADPGGGRGSGAGRPGAPADWPAQPEPRPRRRLGPLVGIAAAVAVLVAGGGTYLYLQKSSAAQAAGGTQPPSGPAANAPEHVVSITPSDGATGVNGAARITVVFSEPLSATSPMPTLSPAIGGTWQRHGRTAVFVPTRGFGARTKVKVQVPGGSAGVQSAGGGLLAGPVTANFRTGSYSSVRIEQLLAQLGYLPLTWAPLTGTAPALSDQNAQLNAAYSPPAGTYTWQSGYPSALIKLWRPDKPSEILRGAVMAFQADHRLTSDMIYENQQGLTLHGSIVHRLWRALFRAAARDVTNKHGYTYALASQKAPETLTVWHNGVQIFRHLANTGIPIRPTAVRTDPVYIRYQSQIMKGRNPDGTKYADPVAWVAYFHGGEAVHYFPRYSYGSQQSLGCVELPWSPAKQIWPYLTFGTLVTVTAP